MKVKYKKGTTMRVVYKKSRSVKGWGRRAPKTRQQRRALHSRCGNRAFLLPQSLGFPIMAKTGACRIDCEGLRVAKSRAGQMASTARRAGKSPTAYLKVKTKANALGRRAGCHWAR